MGMLLALWGLIKTPLGQKITIIVICIILAFGALKWYGHRREEIGKTKGIVIGANDTKQQMEEQWKKREADLTKREATVVTDTKVVDAKKAEIVKLRASLDQTLIQIQATSNASEESANEIISRIPVSELANSIKRKSAELGPPKDTAPGTGGNPVK